MDILSFKNVTVVCFSLLVIANISQADSNDTKIFMDKYGQTKIEPIQVDKFTFNKRDREDISLNKEINSTSYTQVITKISNNEINTSTVAELVSSLRNDEMMHKIADAKKYILDDFNLNVSEYNISSSAATPNDLFAQDRMFLCISSSMPKTLIQSYLQQIEDTNENVEVVLNGFIGGIKKVKETISFINSILMKNEKTAYRVKIQINPKIFMNYDIGKVPALVYDPNFERDLLEETPYKRQNVQNSKVVYGAVSLERMIKEVK